jgi:hypothetical protein
MNIQIKTNYNTILLHHVDSLSRWDEFVSDHHWGYFQDQFKIDEATLNLFNDYSKKRKPLGWRAESSLLEWAYDGFPGNKRFSGLQEPIKSIENLKDKQGRTVREILVEVSIILKDKSAKLYKEHLKYNNKAEEILKVYEKLFGVRGEKKIVCYLVHSPRKGNLQGGANGESIYVELFPYGNEDYSHTSNTIFHESFHKILEVRKKLEKEFTKRKHMDFLKRIPKLYPSPAHKYLDEVIVYTLSDVFLSKDDPDENIKRYSGIDDKHDFHYATVWRGVKYFREFLDSNHLMGMKPDVFYDLLTEKFETFLKKKLYLKAKD